MGNNKDKKSYASTVINCEKPININTPLNY